MNVNDTLAMVEQMIADDATPIAQRRADMAEIAGLLLVKGWNRVVVEQWETPEESGFKLRANESAHIGRGGFLNVDDEGGQITRKYYNGDRALRPGWGGMTRRDLLAWARETFGATPRAAEPVGGPAIVPGDWQIGENK